MLQKKRGGPVRLTDPERRRGEADADLSASQLRAIEVSTARPSVTSAQLGACTCPVHDDTPLTVAEANIRAPRRAY